MAIAISHWAIMLTNNMLWHITLIIQSKWLSEIMHTLLRFIGMQCFGLVGRLFNFLLPVLILI